MKKLIYALFGAMSYLVLSLMLTGYDHMYSHKMINDSIVSQFVARYGSSVNPLDKFYNYYFIFDGGGTMEGEEISKGDMLTPTSSTAKKDVRGWIVHGGMSADEPQLPSSFTHFYDPTQAPGQRYLKDLLDEFYVAWAIENPKVDHVQWAISDERNEYNYEAGKQHFKNALEQADPEFRKMNMAFAWRALGQTLHLIADMGIASHVRDDAHPGVGTGVAGYKYSFDADPYEEVVHHHAKKSGVGSFLNGAVDPAVKAFCKESKTAKSIAEQLASYTNANFFSHETISGAGVKPKAHPEKTYPSPKLENCSYNAEPAIYVKNFGGNSVKMCKDLSYLAVLNDFRGDPYIDEECVLSQAAALLPQIREAGVNTIRCFIPKLEVKITGIHDNSITGEVSHTTDSEYPEAIKYNGLVEIKSQKTQEVLFGVQCKDGKFDETVDLSEFDEVNDKLTAEIICGNIRIVSEPASAEPAPKWNSVQFLIKNLPATVLHTRNNTSNENNISLKWTFDDFYHPGVYANGLFTAEWDTLIDNSSFRHKGSLSLRIDEKTQKITSGRIISEYNSKYSPTKEYYKIDFEVSDITAFSYRSEFASFSLKGSNLCKPGNFKFTFWETLWGGDKNTLVSYSCADNSILAINLESRK
jgi:hypothetical protein